MYQERGATWFTEGLMTARMVQHYMIHARSCNLVSFLSTFVLVRLSVTIATIITIPPPLPPLPLPTLLVPLNVVAYVSAEAEEGWVQRSI